MTQETSVSSLPAVLIGGPPHSGKSVLLYSLSQALRDRGVEHYALRACPDGEGDWSNEAPPALVREIRIKGSWTAEWVERISRDIERRHLPLLVDVGGRPTPEQAEMFSRCTHAVLLTPNEASQAEWRRLAVESGLPILADLTSDLEGEDCLDSSSPLLRGTISGLERHRQANGPTFNALVDRLAETFTVGQDALRRRHLETASAAIELVVDLDRLAVTQGWARPGEKVFWLPKHVPLLLDYLPAGQPLAVYGRGTAWIQAALARLAVPAVYQSFDVRLGWVAAVSLRTGDERPDCPLRFGILETDGLWQLTGYLIESYLDYNMLAEVTPPLAPPGKGVVLSGKLPYWLFTSLATTYREAPWLAVYQPSLGGALVVDSQHDQPVIGTIIPVLGHDDLLQVGS